MPTVIRPATAEVATDAARGSKHGARPMAVEWPHAAAEIHRCEALPIGALVFTVAELNAAGDRQTDLAAGGVKTFFAERYDQIHRLLMVRPLNIQRQVQRQPTDICRGGSQPYPTGELVEVQLHARVLEGMAAEWRIWQAAAAGEKAELAVRDMLAAVQVEKIHRAITDVVDVGLDQRQRPVRGVDGPVIPALAAAQIAGQGTGDARLRRPANGVGIQLARGITEGNGGRWSEVAIHWHVHVCVGRRRACRRRAEKYRQFAPSAKGAPVGISDN